MKRTMAGLGIGFALALVAGCGTHGPVTNGGIPAASVGQLGVKSTTGKAQTGSVMIMDQSSVPPALARKVHMGAGAAPGASSSPN